MIQTDMKRADSADNEGDVISVYDALDFRAEDKIITCHSGKNRKAWER